MKVKIERNGLDRKPWTDEVEADVYGCFAVHESAGLLRHADDYTLTHIPTGYAYLALVTKANAEKAAREILSGKIDWSLVTSPKDLTAAHKAQGKSMRKKYGHGA